MEPQKHTPLATPAPAAPAVTLSDDQQLAWTKILAWTGRRDQPYFSLRGFAGTGKTYLLQKLSATGANVYYTAPTNKAAKVLGNSVNSPAKTTYSMLGLRMEQHEDRLVLTASGREPYFPRGSIVVIDEASMVGRVLRDAVEASRVRYGLRVLYVGDPAQLPPVGEKRSLVWRLAADDSCRAMLKQVMRNDSQLLDLATSIRDCILNKRYVTPLRSAHDATKGVFKYKSREAFIRQLLRRTTADTTIHTKVAAWRNRTVEQYNDIVREHLGYVGPYVVNDVLLLAQPLERDGALVAHTDDEYRVTAIEQSEISLLDCNVPVHRIHARQTDGDNEHILTAAHNQSRVDRLLSRLADAARRSPARERKNAWQAFWSAHGQFDQVRYGYALTAHRLQGSTYTNVYVDQQDILANSNEGEAFRCLYVACTRPTTTLHSY